MYHAAARAAGRNPEEIPGPEPPLRRVVLPVSRAPQTAGRTGPHAGLAAGVVRRESDEDAARALAVCAAARCEASASAAATADRAEGRCLGRGGPVRGGPGVG